jgi:hypothetical protein
VIEPLSRNTMTKRTASLHNQTKRVTPRFPKNKSILKDSNRKMKPSIKARFQHDDENNVAIKQRTSNSARKPSEKLSRKKVDTIMIRNGNSTNDREYIVEEIVNFDPNYKNLHEAHFEIKWKGYKK